MKELFSDISFNAQSHSPFIKIIVFINDKINYLSNFNTHYYNYSVNSAKKPLHKVMISSNTHDLMSVIIFINAPFVHYHFDCMVSCGSIYLNILLRVMKLCQLKMKYVIVVLHSIQKWNLIRWETKILSKLLKLIFYLLNQC